MSQTTSHREIESPEIPTSFRASPALRRRKCRVSVVSSLPLAPAFILLIVAFFYLFPASLPHVRSHGAHNALLAARASTFTFYWLLLYLLTRSRTSPPISSRA
jgi:hypothetical protein